MEIEEEPHIRTNPQRRSRFLMEIVRLVESKFLSVAEKIPDVLEGNCDFRAIEAKLKKELDSLGCEILPVQSLKHFFQYLAPKAV